MLPTGLKEATESVLEFVRTPLSAIDQMPADDSAFDHACFHALMRAAAAAPGLLGQVIETLRPGLRVPDGGFELMPWSVWGEMRPFDILALDGTRLMLLGPPLLRSRTWNAGFFAPLHGALRSSARIEEALDSRSVADWIERIRQAPRPD